eukprot:654259-Prorocentrum_minimum.AAC.1
MTDQSDTGNPTVGLDTDAVGSIVKALLSHLGRFHAVLPPILYGRHMSASHVSSGDPNDPIVLAGSSDAPPNASALPPTARYSRRVTASGRQHAEATTALDLDLNLEPASASTGASVGASKSGSSCASTMAAEDVGHGRHVDHSRTLSNANANANANAKAFDSATLPSATRAHVTEGADRASPSPCAGGAGTQPSKVAEVAEVVELEREVASASARNNDNDNDDESEEVEVEEVVEEVVEVMEIQPRNSRSVSKHQKGERHKQTACKADAKVRVAAKRAEYSVVVAQYDTEEELVRFGCDAEECAVCAEELSQGAQANNEVRPQAQTLKCAPAEPRHTYYTYVTACLPQQSPTCYACVTPASVHPRSPGAPVRMAPAWRTRWSLVTSWRLGDELAAPRRHAGEAAGGDAAGGAVGAGDGHIPEPGTRPGVLPRALRLAGPVAPLRHQ